MIIFFYVEPQWKFILLSFIMKKIVLVLSVILVIFRVFCYHKLILVIFILNVVKVGKGDNVQFKYWF